MCKLIYQDELVLPEIEVNEEIIQSCIDYLIECGFTPEDYEKEFSELRKKLTENQEEIRLIKQLNHRIVEEIGNLARKTEVESLQKQMKMFEPLEFARIQDIKNIIKQELKKR